MENRSHHIDGTSKCVLPVQATEKGLFKTRFNFLIPTECILSRQVKRVILEDDEIQCILVYKLLLLLLLNVPLESESIYGALMFTRVTTIYRD